MFALRLGLTALVVLTAAGCSAEPRPTPDIVAATPVITFVGIDEADRTELTASGVVDGVSESGGTCGFTFWAENGGASRLTADGVPDGDRTACGPVSIDAVQLPAGSYSVVLIYESATAAGVSESVSLVLP